MFHVSPNMSQMPQVPLLSQMSHVTYVTHVTLIIALHVKRFFGSACQQPWISSTSDFCGMLFMGGRFFC